MPIGQMAVLVVTFRVMARMETPIINFTGEQLTVDGKQTTQEII
jgi:hypothetical protein